MCCNLTHKVIGRALAAAIVVKESGFLYIYSVAVGGVTISRELYHKMEPPSADILKMYTQLAPRCY